MAEWSSESKTSQQTTWDLESEQQISTHEYIWVFHQNTP
jgi:hypothetical protein